MRKPRVSAWLTGLRETVEQLPDFVRVAAEAGVTEVYLQRLVFFEENAIGMARPDQALYEQLSREEAAYIDRAAALAASLGITFSASGAASEPGMSLKRQRQWLAVVAVPPAVDRHVHHRQRPRVALLHRAVLAARLRELHARRRHPADLAGNLDRPGLSRFPRARSCRTSRRRPAPIAACAGACNLAAGQKTA